MSRQSSIRSLLALGILAAVLPVQAAPTNPPNNCAGLPDSATLETALKTAAGASNGGFDLPIWATVVNRYGVVCAVATTASEMDGAWLNSRVISAQKAYTANGFSLPGLAISSAQLFSATQPGGSLFGLQHSNPVDPRVVYRGDSTKYGTATDPMLGLKPGGINVFGGGLALYSGATKLGALGVSGDSSCADHNIAWRARNELSKVGGTVSVTNSVPSGLRTAQVGTTAQPVAASGKGDDGIMYGTTGFQHASCGGAEAAQTLPALN
ncbi:MAG: heme-binding protein [Methylibium sp.]|nr:heme-binding protein [Methylibium sp.]